MAIFSGIAYALGWIGGFVGAAIGLSTTAAVALGTALGQIGAALALGKAASMLKPKINVPSEEVKAVLTQGNAARRIVVGRMLIGGIRAFYEVKGSTLFQLVVCNHGRLDTMEEFWVDGGPVLLDENGWVISGSTYLSKQVLWVDLTQAHVRVQRRNGATDGGQYSALTGDFPAWTSDHKLTGQATYLVMAKAPKPEDFQKAFPKGAQTTYQWVVRGAQLHDPRDNQTRWSDNAALVMLHYLRTPEGYGLTSPEIGWEDFEGFADHSAEAVPLAGGGTEPRYRLWGYWTMDEPPQQVINRLRGSCGFGPYMREDGRVGLIGGPFGTPVCTITTKDIKGIRRRSRISERSGYNTLRTLFMSPGHKYEMTEVAPWVDDARAMIEGEIAQDFEALMCPSFTQARRLAKRRMHDDNRGEIIITTNAVGIKARFPHPDRRVQRHTINLEYRPEGRTTEIVGEFEVIDHAINPLTMECQIALAPVDRASEIWSTAEEGPPPAPMPIESSNPAPDLDADMIVVVTEVTAGQKQARIQVEAAAVGDRTDLTLLARHRRTSGGGWRTMTSDGYTATSEVVEDGTTHEVEVRWEGVFDGVQPWEPLGSILIAADQTPPGETGAIGNEQLPDGTVRIWWRNPMSSFHRLQIYRNTVADGDVKIAETGGAVGQESEFIDENPVTGDPSRYRVRAVNASGIPGNFKTSAWETYT